MRNPGLCQMGSPHTDDPCPNLAETNFDEIPCCWECWEVRIQQDIMPPADCTDAMMHDLEETQFIEQETTT